MRTVRGLYHLEDSKANNEKAWKERAQVQKRLQAQQSWNLYKVMEKYGNKSPFMKFVHKNTGYIVVGVLLVVLAPIVYSTMESQEFFERWSCGNLEWYALSYNQELHNQDFPDHKHLTEEQHARFHEVIAECNFVFEHK